MLALETEEEERGKDDKGATPRELVIDAKYRQLGSLKETYIETLHLLIGLRCCKRWEANEGAASRIKASKKPGIDDKRKDNFQVCRRCQSFIANMGLAAFFFLQCPCKGSTELTGMDK